MSEKGFGQRRHEVRGALIGGVVTASFLFAVIIAVGALGSFEALRLIESILPTARFLGSAVVGASVTVLALLLTLVGLSLNSEYAFHPRLYSRAVNITRIAVASMIMGVGVLLMVSVPIGELDELRSYYSILYYLISAAIAVLGGLVTTMGLLIGATLRSLIHVGQPGEASDFLESGTRS
jgi:hypothetical protein